MSVCLRSQPSCHASLKFAGYSNLLNGDILKMSNLKLFQPGVKISGLKYVKGKIRFIILYTSSNVLKTTFYHDKSQVRYHLWAQSVLRECIRRY